MTERRHCQGKTKTGKPCRARPLTNSDYCLAHSDAKTREKVGFIPDNGKAGRPANPKPSEVARQLIERNVLALQRPYWLTLGYDVKIGPDGPYLVERADGGAKLYGESKDGDISMSSYEDLGAQMAAAEKLQDRVYGRPKQQTELTGANGGPIDVVPVARDRAPDVVRILTGTGSLPVPVPNGNGNGSHN